MAAYKIITQFTVGSSETNDYCAYKMTDTITGVSNAFSAIETYKNRILAKYETANIFNVECAATEEE